MYAKTTPLVPIVELTIPGSTTAVADPSRGLVATSANHRRPCLQSSRLRRVRADTGLRHRRFGHPRQVPGSERKCVQNLTGPAAARDVEQQGSRPHPRLRWRTLRSGGNGRNPFGSSSMRSRSKFAGSWSRTQRSFGTVKPVRAGLHVISLNLAGSDPLGEPVRLFLAALVAPDNRRPDDLVARVEQYRTVHLPDNPTSGDVAARQTGPGQRAARIASWAARHQSSGSCSAQLG